MKDSCTASYLAFIANQQEISLLNEQQERLLLNKALKHFMELDEKQLSSLLLNISKDFGQQQYSQEVYNLFKQIILERIFSLSNTKDEMND